jgi:sigma-B regulation protein RsbU (phosphoserine phosphatase)
VYANAGHPPPLIANPDGGTPKHLPPTGLVLGVELSATWSQAQANLAPGDLLLLYTDGVTEAQDASGAFFEPERLVGALLACAPAGAEATVADLLGAVRGFAGAAPQSDDITLLVAARGA